MAVYWRPAGPLPAATYWRRRGVLAAAVVVLVLVARSCAGGGGGGGRPAAHSSPTPAPRAHASASVPAITPGSAPGLCADGDLLVTPTTDATTYQAGSTPVLTVAVKNTSAAACRRALGPAAVELIVMSGNDRIWSSQDCAPGGSQDVLTLRPGQEHVTRITWSGHRSAPGCTGTRPAAQPGTYRLTARVGTLRQLGATFHVA